MTTPPPGTFAAFEQAIMRDVRRITEQMAAGLVDDPATSVLPASAFPATKSTYGAVTLSREILRDHGWWFPGDPDRNPFPHMDPVPWFTAALTTVRTARQRATDAWGVLLHGLPECEDCW